MDAGADDRATLSKARVKHGFYCLCLLSFLGYLIFLNLGFYFYDIWPAMDDTENYYAFTINRVFDVTHWLTVTLMTLLGFPIWISFLCFIFVPLCLLYYLEDVKKSYLAILCSCYMVFVILGVYSELLAFGFFLLFMKDYYLKRSVLWGFMSAISHPGFIPCIIAFICTKGHRKLVVFLAILSICFYILNYHQYSQYSFFNLGLKTSSYNEPSYMLLIFIINPFLLNLKNKKLDYWLFFIIGLLAHNGRYMLYFIPFLIRDYNGKEDRIAWIYGLFLSILCLLAPLYKIIHL
jgi:hypothetical protein